MHENLDSKVAKAAKWSVLAEVFARITPPIVNMILARLLLPEAFGIVASITIITSFADIFTDAGFQKYIIQHEYRNEAELKTSLDVAFTSNLIVSIITYIAIFAFSESLAKLIGCPDESKGIIVASLSVICTAFSSILLARFKRDLDFKSVFYIRICSAIVPLLVTVPIAFLVRSYWAVVIGTLCQQAFIAIFALFISDWKPHFLINIEVFKSMLSFSLWNLCETLSIWFAAQASVFIVANILNPYYLGLYKTATATINSYMAIITASITPVLFSALSRYQNDEKAFQSTFFRFQSVLALLVMPMGAGVFMYRDLVLAILLGKKWVEATTLLGLWALVSSITIVFSNTACEVYRSKGKPKISFFLQMIYLVFFVPSIYLGAKASFVTLVYISCGIRLLPVIFDQFVLNYLFKIPIKDIISNSVWPSIASIIMSIFAFVMKAFSTNVVWELFSIFLCIILYFLIIITNRHYRELVFSLPMIKKIENMIIKR